MCRLHRCAPRCSARPLRPRPPSACAARPLGSPYPGCARRPRSSRRCLRAPGRVPSASGGVSFPPNRQPGRLNVHVEGYATCLTPPIDNIRVYHATRSTSPRSTSGLRARRPRPAQRSRRPRRRQPPHPPGPTRPAPHREEANATGIESTDSGAGRQDPMNSKRGATICTGRESDAAASVIFGAAILAAGFGVGGTNVSARRSRLRRRARDQDGR